MKVYKLTDQNMKTYDGFQWTLGETKTANGNGPLCSPAWLHFYIDPNLAIILNPIHANIKNPRLFEAETDDGKILMDKQLKGGSTKLILVEELERPNITLISKIAFGILCAKKVSKDEGWSKWADNWLNSSDRTIDTAKAAYYAAYAAADTAVNAAYAAAANATDYARAANATDADAAYYAATAAYAAADAAAYAAARAAYADNLDLLPILQQALTIN
jgi:hypothetical protein